MRKSPYIESGGRKKVILESKDKEKALRNVKLKE